MSNQIYQNQKDAAKDIFTRWKEAHKPIILVAQCQSGKTGALLSLCDEIILRDKKEPQYKETKIYPMGPADTNLEKQTLREFKNHETTIPSIGISVPYLMHCIEKECCKQYLHWGAARDTAHSFFLDLKKQRDKKKFVIGILDESHLGQGEESKYDDFYQRYEIPLGCDRQCKDNEIYIACSATPSPRISGKSLEEIRDKYSVCYMKPGDSYYGVAEFLRDERIKQTFDPILNFESFKDEVLAPFLSGEAGSLIIRIPRESKIEDFKNIYEHHLAKLCSCKIYDSERGTIKDLDNDLLNDKNTHCIRIIKQSYRQGMVLKNKHLIRGWFDTSSEGKNSSSDLQSIGRNFGYDDQEGRYKISELKYNIWCNKKDAKKASLYYEQIELLSDGKFDSVDINLLQMSSTHVNVSAKKQEVRAVFYKTFESHDEASRHLADTGIAKKKSVVTRLWDHKKDNNIDYAKGFIAGYLKLNLEGITHVIVDCTKPQPGYEESWELLEQTGDYIKEPIKSKFAIAQVHRLDRSVVSKNNSMH